MLKWCEKVDQKRPEIVSSRVRLVRNWSQYAFPSRLPQKESAEMLHRLEMGLQNLGSLDGKHYEYRNLGELGELEKKALQERRVFNSTIWMSCGRGVTRWMTLSMQDFPMPLIKNTDTLPPFPQMWEPA